MGWTSPRCKEVSNSSASGFLAAQILATRTGSAPPGASSPSGRPTEPTLASSVGGGGPARLRRRPRPSPRSPRGPGGQRGGSPAAAVHATLRISGIPGLGLEAARIGRGRDLRARGIPRMFASRDLRVRGRLARMLGRPHLPVSQGSDTLFGERRASGAPPLGAQGRLGDPRDDRGRGEASNLDAQATWP